jgi:dsRNA-specific ribonuclease
MNTPTWEGGAGHARHACQLTDRDLAMYFPNGAVVLDVPLFEVELSSSFLTFGHMPASIADLMDFVDPSRPLESKPATPGEEDAYIKRKRWKQLGPLLGKRQVRFALIFTDHIAQAPQHISLLEEDLFMPSDAVSSRLHYLGRVELSIENFERVRLFHSSLLWLLYGNNTLVDPYIPRFSQFASKQPMNVLIVPLSMFTPNFKPTLKNPSSSSDDPSSKVNGPSNSSAQTASTHDLTEVDILSSQLAQSIVMPPINDDQSNPILKSSYASSFIDWRKVDLFLSSRQSEPYDEFKHLAGSVVRTTYNSAVYILVDRLPGEGLDTPMDYTNRNDDPHIASLMAEVLASSKSSSTTTSSSSFTATNPKQDSYQSSDTLHIIPVVPNVQEQEPIKITMRQYMTARWKLTKLKNTRFLLMATPLIFKIKLAMHSFPTASKWVLTTAGYKPDLPDFAANHASTVPNTTSPFQFNNRQQQKPNWFGELKASKATETDQTPTNSFQDPFTLQSQVQSLVATTVDKVGRRLIPDLIQVLPLSLFDLNFSAYLPSIIMSLQRRLSSLQMHWDIATYYIQPNTEVLYPATVATMEESLTCPSASEFRNYERLETLGDTALKFSTSWYLFLTLPDAGEGGLTDAKMKLISNKFLANAENAHVIHRLCFLHQLCMDVKKMRGRTSLSMKMKADLCESVLGHFFVNFGDEGIRVFLSWLDSGHRNLITQAMKILSSVTKPYFLEPPSFWKEDSSHIYISPSLPSLGYTFKNRHLLATALTHGSAKLRPTGQTFERLEFLGDACLDLLIVSIMYHNTNLNPGEMSAQRSAIAGNANYAFLAILFDLHRLLIHDSSAIFQEQCTYIEALETKMREEGYKSLIELLGSPFVRQLKFPDCLSDLFEGVAGAVFLDLCGDVKTFARVYIPIMDPLVKRHLEFDLKEKGQRHPHSELIELMQKLKCLSLQKITEEGKHKFVWHGMILAEAPITIHQKSDLQLLSMHALENIHAHSYLWDELCTCAEAPCNAYY